MRKNFTAVWAALALGTLVPPVGASAQTAEGHKATFQLTRIGVKLPIGEPWRTIQTGTFCKTRDTQIGDGALKTDKVSTYAPVFAREADLPQPHEGTQNNLFDRPDQAGSGADYEIGALVHGLDITLCARKTVSVWNFVGVPIPGSVRVSGSARMSVQWQIYSTAKRAVVATVETSGVYNVEATGAEAIQKGVLGAFGRNARDFADSTRVTDLLKAPATGSGSPQTASFGKLMIVSGPAPPRSPAEAVGAVVIVDLPDGWGSGVLISADGYILTNQHVVGAAKTVRIRWSDGLETDGEVLRTHKARDVALIKTDPRGRDPLPVRQHPAQLGEPVLAIGTPKDQGLQNTVTRGVVSANRIFDGFSFIQSDVGVNHGNSGGPLIDDKGYVIGLTDLGRTGDAGDPIGLNFFIPIKDALDFLGVDLTQPPAPPVQKASAPAATSVSTRR